SLAALRAVPWKRSLGGAATAASNSGTADGVIGGSYGSTSVVRRIRYSWPTAGASKPEGLNKVSATIEVAAGMPAAGGDLLERGASPRARIPLPSLRACGMRTVLPDNKGSPGAIIIVCQGPVSAL